MWVELVNVCRSVGAAAVDAAATDLAVVIDAAAGGGGGGGFACALSLGAQKH